MLIDFLSARARTSTSADRPCQWEASSSELGLDTGSAPAAPAEEAAPPHEAAADDTTQADHQPAEEGDDDADQDPLDLLTEREDAEPEGQPRTIEDRYKALKQRARKLEKQLKKNLPSTHALRESGLDVRALISRHQQLANLEAAMDRNPRLRALLNGEDDASLPATPNTRRQPAPADDEIEYPFDINDQVGQFVSNFHKATTQGQRDILARIEQLEQGIGTRVGRIEQQTMQRQRAETMTNWKSAASAAAEKLEPGVRAMFLDAVLSAAENGLAGRHKLSAQQVISHYLKGLKVSQGQKDRANAAAGQRMAERNNNLPRRPAQGNGSPASPAAKRVPRLEEFNRTLGRMAR